jgi:hemerythrin-like domain-containing protein
MLHRNPAAVFTGVDSPPMHLLDAPAGFDDPVGLWLGCHRRIEKQLKTLLRLAPHVAGNGADAEATAAAQAILRYFDRAGPHHHEDEERDLFPLLDRRITDAQALAAFRELRARLEEDHRHMNAAWARLRKPLASIAEGIAKPLDAQEIRDFCAAYEKHIAAEDGAIAELARTFLSSADFEALGRSMSERRGVDYPA